MKQLLILFALLAACSLGCGETATSKSDLLMEVDAAGLESTIAKNQVTLVEFTSDT